MTIRPRNNLRRWWCNAAASAATCFVFGPLASPVNAQDFTPISAAPFYQADVASPPALPLPPAAPLTPAVDSVAALPHPVPPSPSTTAFPAAGDGHGAASYAELEARLRELEARFASEPTRFAGLSTEPAAGKAEAPKGSVIGSDPKMYGNWKDGGQIESADKAFRVKWRGRTQFDAVGFTDANTGYFQGLGGNLGETTADFRRLRLGTEGVLYEQFDFAVELDFINSFNTNSTSAPFAPNANLKNSFDRQFTGVPAPTDVWIGMHDVPIVGNFRIGNIKPANGLEHANSSRFLDFMERSLMQDAFTGRFNNGFQPGILFQNYNEKQTATSQISICENTYNVFAYDAGGIDAASRVTWTPINDKESHGRYLLHLGCSVTERRPTDGQERIRARSSLRNGISQSWSNVADTTIFFTDNELLLIPEIAAVYGPWHFQAEYFGQWNSNVRLQQSATVLAPGPNTGTAYFNGYYMQLSYFLTGEHREYEGKNGCFGRVVPYENFHLIRRKGAPPLRTLGAWQILYRYEVLDLNDPRLATVNAWPATSVPPGTPGATGVGGGTVVDHTIGLNHFWNPNMKMQYNLLFADRTANAASPIGGAQTGGHTVGFGARMALDF